MTRLLLLNTNDIVAIPTETVYGLAGNIFSEKAVKAIFETKQRPFFNPLIVHIPNIDYLETIVEEVPEKARLLAEAFWPGPITLVLKKKPLIPDLITGGKDTVAVRIPNHPLTLELLSHLDFPLAAPSANPFGSISPTTAQHVDNYFSNTLQMILDGGPCRQGIESTIIGFEKGHPVLYRHGSISKEEIEAQIGPLKTVTHSETAPQAPGMLAKHYSPKTRTVLTKHVEESLHQYSGERIGLLQFKNPKTATAVPLVKVYPL